MSNGTTFRRNDACPHRLLTSGGGGEESFDESSALNLKSLNPTKNPATNPRQTVALSNDPSVNEAVKRGLENQGRDRERINARSTLGNANNDTSLSICSASRFADFQRRSRQPFNLAFFPLLHPILTLAAEKQYFAHQRLFLVLHHFATYPFLGSLSIWPSSFLPPASQPHSQSSEIADQCRSTVISF